MSESEGMELAVKTDNLPTVVEPAKESKADGFSIDMQDIFKSLLMQSNHAAHEAETKLQVEKSGNKVADLQGFCAGIRNFKSVAKKSGFDIPPTLFDTANRMTPWVQTLDNEGEDAQCDLSLSALRLFSEQLDNMVKSDAYAALEDAVQAEIKAKKDWLFGDAKAGRDLFWVRGWHCGFSWVQTQIKELHYWKEVKEQQAAKKAKEKAESLPFGDDEDEDF